MAKSNDYELLNQTYKNAKMGTTGIANIIDSVEDVEFKKVLQKQDRQYGEIAGEAAEKLHLLGEEPKDLTTMAKIGSFVSSETGTMMDSSASHLAEMMIQGSTMGVTKLMKKTRECSKASHEAQGLAQRLLSTEQCNIEELKKYL